MRKIYFYILLGLLSGFIFYFLGNNVITPYNKNHELLAVNIIIMVLFLDITLISLFTAIHFWVHKLLKKNKASEKLALRRAFTIALTIDFLIYLKTANLITTLSISLTIALAIVIEIFISSLQRKKEEETNI